MARTTHRHPNRKVGSNARTPTRTAAYVAMDLLSTGIVLIVLIRLSKYLAMALHLLNTSFSVEVFCVKAIAPRGATASVTADVSGS